MSRSFTVNLVDDKGRVIADAWARAFRDDTQVEVETRYTDATGCATFTTLPENVDCSILCLWGRQSRYFFSEATIGTTEIDNLAVTNAKISDAAISTAKVADGSINAPKIANLAVTNAKISDAAISTAKIADLAVSTAKLGNVAVTNAKIAAAAVSTAEIANAAVTNAKINDCSITKLTAGNLNVTGTIASTGKFITAASPNPRIEITQTLIAGYSDATTKQFYLQASDGKAYFGAGACTLDSEGITLKGQKLTLQQVDGTGTGTIYIENDRLQLHAWEIELGDIYPLSDETYFLGISSKRWSVVWTNNIKVDGGCYPCAANTGNVGDGTLYFLGMYATNMYRTNEYSFQRYDDIALIRQMKEDNLNPKVIDKKTIPDVLIISPAECRQKGKDAARAKKEEDLIAAESIEPDRCREKTKDRIHKEYKQAILRLDTIDDKDFCNIDAFKEISLAFGAIRQLADKLDVLEKLVQKIGVK